MQSQYNLGSLYANDYFSDNVEGLTWLLRSQEKAKTCASEELCQWVLNDPPGHVENLKGRMTSAQIEEAVERSSE